MDRLIAESVPAQIKARQQEIAQLERTLVERRAQLRRLLDTAVLHGIEFFPNAVPAPQVTDAEPPPALAGTDGGPVARVA